MNAKLIVYRLITFILLPIAGINAIGVLGILPTAFGSPMVLILVVIYSTIIVYTFASFIFFIKGVQNGKTLKPTLRDLVKINAYITAAVALIILIIDAFYFISPVQQKAVYDNLAKLPSSMNPNNVSKEELVHTFRSALIFFGAYSAVLLFHIIITLQLIKKHKALFSTGN